MNLEKVVFGFFILLAATLNFGFVYGDIDDPALHDRWELFAAVVVNLIAAVLKFGDRTHIGAVHLASSLVALLQLAAATVVWVVAAARRRPVAARRPRASCRSPPGRCSPTSSRSSSWWSRRRCSGAEVGGLFFISIRRLRAPLVFLIVVFAISTAGFALIPGVDAEGKPWRPTLFEAFYFVTYTATTIGFGELPYAFTDRQRLWVTVIIYLR